jgi:Fe-S cluster biogenesis protein NfuA
MTTVKQHNAELMQRIEKSLDTLRPYLETDGGNIEVVEVTSDHVLKVRLIGNCEACPMSITTMKAGVEQAILREIPEILRVEAI